MELDEIYLYIRDKLKESKIAEKIQRKIREQIRMLSYFPLANKLIKKPKNLNIENF